MSAQDFLVEIGTEELPPKALKYLLKSFSGTLLAELDAAGLAHERDAVRIFASPRRLAIQLTALAVAQPERIIEKLGPFVAQAYKADGSPTPAALGFAGSNGVSLDQLTTTPSEKGDRLLFNAVEAGRLAIDLLPAMVEKALHELPIPRRMRWGSKRTEFVRPVHWVVMLYGSSIVDCDILGVSAGRQSRGHRFMASNAPVNINRPADYQTALREHHVEACFRVRRNLIEAQVEACAKAVGGRAIIDRDLLDEVTSLVEWPVALTGKFDPDFLQVPQEALISSMSEHQKYFHVVDANDRLMPCFITISNLESRDPSQVIDGNERVIRPRLTDAAFFYQTDLKQPLSSRCERLKTIVFQAKLGSVYEKSRRVALLASHIAQQVQGNTGWAHRAGELSKADLISNMVLEFDSMQGVAGSYYALHDGEPAEVAQALREQYLPRFAGDAIATSCTGRSLAIADRIDTLVGIFGIGQVPTGSKDPFALRRASIGVLMTLIRAEFDLDLAGLIIFARQQYQGVLPAGEVETAVLEYMLERLRGICIEDGMSTEAFNAVHVRQLSNPLDIYRRVQAVYHFAALPGAESLAAANKRVTNILARANDISVDGGVRHDYLHEPARKHWLYW
jgi:glycyl-tRNA synthetase beta chain